jgi:beta-glucosidase
LTIEKRVNDLLGRMTIEGKIQQMDMYWGREVANMEGYDAECLFLK